MLAKIAIKKFKNSEIAIKWDGRSDEHDILNFLRKIVKNYKKIEADYFYFDKKLNMIIGQKSNCNLPPVINLSEIKDEYDVLLTSKIQMEEDEYIEAGSPAGFKKIRKYYSLFCIWITGYSQDFPMKYVYQEI